jgi:hypothetical protein
MKINFDTIYLFDFTGKVRFGDMPNEELYQLFKDGRVSSKFLESYIPIWFPELKFVDQDGYDHIDVATESVKWDLKGFTKGGASYVPSSMIGAGRKINIEEAQEHANEINYIFSDITEFPNVRIQFKTGKELVKQFPSGKIASKYKDQLFNGVNIIDETKK